MTSQADREAQRHADEAAQHVNDWTEANIEKGGVCDFCCAPLSEFADDALVTYVSDPIEGKLEVLDGHTLGAASIDFGWDPYWVACPACAAVVDDGDPVALANYVLDNRHESQGGKVEGSLRRVLVPDFILLYREFFGGKPVAYKYGREPLRRLVRDTT